ncbi:hypothetical protein IE077_003718 [Cardiosporidium cionae]|uniref:NAD-dependent epimerase/dehydratase domain-containing protein n=1 Tax=Cardiosporidium cionae TaxID=476202 RepID=A0ABQ7JER5_9APIC|nr:hypothetical protein IE077_003718 [Cardiosporidium cionae]|eukprot:KAF8822454.1 hypothetical protein IE077_003718 [Cardiosporidium cionae]
MKILVLGGSGYVGAQICRKATQSGMDVVSISRNGAPKRFLDMLWAQQVEWKQADALSAEVYPPLLENCAGIVHSIGALFDNDLNRFVSGSSSTTDGRSYDAINRDTALVAMRQALASGDPKFFVFISAKSAPPMFSAYLKAKREAEVDILSNASDTFRPIIFRPGFIFHSSRTATIPISKALDTVFSVNKYAQEHLRISIPGLESSTSLETLSDSVIEACVNPSVHGILDNDDMLQLVGRDATQ